MEQHWRFKLSWYADGAGRVVAARVEHVDLEVRPPELIMEIAVVAEVEPEGVEVAPPERTSESEEPGWVTPTAGDGGGVSDAGGPPDFAEVAAAGAGDPGGGGLPPEGVDRGDGPGEAAAGGTAARGASEEHGWADGMGDEADEAAQAPSTEAARDGAEAGPESPGGDQDAGPPAGTTADPCEPRPLQELLWEGIREVRQLDAAAARRSIVSFAGRNIVIGGP